MPAIGQNSIRGSLCSGPYLLVSLIVHDFHPEPLHHFHANLLNLGSRNFDRMYPPWILPKQKTKVLLDQGWANGLILQGGGVWSQWTIMGCLISIPKMKCFRFWALSNHFFSVKMIWHWKKAMLWRDFIYNHCFWRNSYSAMQNPAKSLVGNKNHLNSGNPRNSQISLGATNILSYISYSETKY